MIAFAGGGCKRLLGGVCQCCKQTLDLERHRAASDDLRPELHRGRGNGLRR